MSVIDKEKVNTIEENVPKVYHSGRFNVIKDSTYLKGSESGEHIYLDDVSDIEHTLGVKVSSKNLFNASKSKRYYDASINGFKKSSNGRIFALTETLKELANLQAGETYIITATHSHPDDGGKFVWLNESRRKWDWGNAITLTQADLDGEVYFYKCSSDTNPVANEEVTIANIQIEKGKVATAYTPYMNDFSSIEVGRYGKNLADYNTVQNEFDSPISNIVITNEYIDVQKKGTYTYNTLTLPTLKAGTTYTLWADVEIYDRSEGTASTMVQCRLSTYDANTQRDLYNNGDKTTWIWSYKPTEDMNDVRVHFRTNYGSQVGAKGKWRIMVIVGSYTASSIPDFALSYPSQFVTANADGTVEGLKSISPEMNILTDTDGVVIDCDYYKDIDKAYSKLQQTLALSGGE